MFHTFAKMECNFGNFMSIFEFFVVEYPWCVVLIDGSQFNNVALNFFGSEEV